MPPTLPKRNTVLPGIQATSRSVIAPSASSSFHVNDEFADLSAVFAQIYFFLRSVLTLFRGTLLSSTGLTRSREHVSPCTRVHHRRSSCPVAAIFPPRSHPSSSFLVAPCAVSFAPLSVTALVPQGRFTCAHGTISHRAHLLRHGRDANASTTGDYGHDHGDDDEVTLVQAAHSRRVAKFGRTWQLALDWDRGW